MNISRFTKHITPYLYQLPSIVLLSILMVIPIITVFRYSLYDNVIMKKNPRFLGIDNYIKLFENETFWISLYNTFYFTFFSLFFHLLLGMIFALLLNYSGLNIVIKSIFRVVYILPWLFTATIIAIMWRLLLDPSGIINYILQYLSIIEDNIEWFSSTDTALNAVTFVNIWAGYPFYMVSLLAGLQGVPKDLYEASDIDGANVFQQFLHVALPHLKPIILTILLLDFIWTMQVFPLVWMTTGGGPIYTTEMLGTFTYKLAFTKYKFSLASASAFITLIITIGISIFYIRKQITKV